MSIDSLHSPGVEVGPRFANWILAVYLTKITIRPLRRKSRVETEIDQFRPGSVRSENVVGGRVGFEVTRECRENPDPEQLP